MGTFVWVAMGMFGSCAVGFLAGMFVAEYEPPAPPFPYVEPPASHVFRVPGGWLYNGMPVDVNGYSDPPEFYDWAVHGECLHRGTVDA